MIDDLENSQGIYVITQISTGVKYVGKSVRVRNRVRSHIKKGHSLIHQAIKEFGVNDFRVEARYLPDVSPKELVDIEYETIINEGSLFPSGFNQACRGHDNVIDRSHLIGRKRSAEARKNMSVPHHMTKKGIHGLQQARRDSALQHTFVNMKTNSVFIGIIPDFIHLHGFKNSAKTALSTRKRHAGWNMI